MIKVLKDKRIKDRKPNLKLMPNHYHYISGQGRVWDSKVKGTAYRYGDWYRERKD